MARIRNANKVPREWVYCPTCSLAYAFVRCRVTISTKEGVRNICLPCLVQERKLKPPLQGSS